MIEENFLTKAKFSKLVEQTVFEKRLSYMDAIVWLCEKHNIEIEDCRKFINPIIKDKLEAEARRLNFLPRTNELSFE
ncbi:MAG: late promoter transcription accessory protein [Candidatus Poseidoniales archaeon]